jgi:hypothetical protein
MAVTKELSASRVILTDDRNATIFSSSRLNPEMTASDTVTFSSAFGTLYGGPRPVSRTFKEVTYELADA